MLLEDRLEVLLSTGGLPDVTGEDTQLMPLLDAAQQLTPLRVATPSPHSRTDFMNCSWSALLLCALVTCVADEADVYGNASTEPDVAVVRPIASRPIALRRQEANRASRPFGARWWQVAVAAMLCLLFGAFSLAVRQTSLPNDTVHMHLTRADNALQSYDALVAANADDTALADALSTLLSEHQAATQGLSAVLSGGDHDALAAQLMDFEKRARDDLHAALGRLDWTSRLRATAALGRLGEQVLTVSTVRITRGDDDIPNAPWRIQVQGSGFVSGAIVLFGGHVEGVISSVTPTDLVAEWTDGTPPSGVSIGVQNPDDTGAETSNISVHSDDGDDASATPSAFSRRVAT